MSGLTRILVLGGLVLAAVLVFVSPCLLRGWMRKLAGVALGVLVLCATSLLGYGAYRRWLDDVRVANVNTIYQVIERYKETTGKCPLQERFADAPMGVNTSDRPCARPLQAAAARRERFHHSVRGLSCRTANWSQVRGNTFQGPPDRAVRSSEFLSVPLHGAAFLCRGKPLVRPSRRETARVSLLQV